MTSRYRHARRLREDVERLRNALVAGARAPDLPVAAALAITALVFGTKAVASMHAANGAVLYTPSAGPIHLSNPWRFGQLLLAVALSAYGICRLALGRVSAAVVTLLLVSSPVSLYVLASSPIRDYFRAPIIYPLVFMLGVFVVTATNIRRAAAIAGVYGAITGLGSYYREDLLTFLAVALVTIVVLAPVPWRQWRPRAGAAAALAAAYVLTMPIATARVGVFSINFTAGFMSAMDGQLGLSRPSYDIGSLFLDDHIYSSWELVTRPKSPPEEQAAFLPSYIRYFPGDFATRIVAGVDKVLGAPLAHRSPPPGLDRGGAGLLYRARARLSAALQPLAWPLFIAAGIALATVNLRFSAFHAMWLLFIGGLSIAQPWGRNSFYAELFTLWNTAFVIEQLVRRRPVSPDSWRRGLIWAGVLAAAAIATAATIGAARQYQEATLRDLLRAYGAASTEPRATLPPAHVETNRTARFFVADFSGSNCDVEMLWPVLRYDKQMQCGNPADPADWSRSVRVQRGAKLFFPAWDGFRSVDLSADEAGCLTSVRQVVAANRFPLWMTATVPAQGVLYQRLARWEEPRLRWAASPPASDAIGARLLAQPGNGLTPTTVFRNSIVDATADGWRIGGYAQPPFDPHWCPSLDRSSAALSVAWGLQSDVALLDTDLFQTAPRDVPGGAYFVVEGEVNDGGIALGLLRDGKGAGHMTIETPGPFTAVFRADRQGRYSFGVANRLYWYTYPEVRANIRRARWVIPS